MAVTVTATPRAARAPARAALALLAGMACTPAAGVEVTVSPGDGTLAAAISAAAPGDRLVLAPGIVRLQPLIDEIVEAGQGSEADLPAELVETRYAALAVANNVERNHVDFARRRSEVRHRQVLQEMRMVA